MVENDPQELHVFLSNISFLISKALCCVHTMKSSPDKSFACII